MKKTIYSDRINRICYEGLTGAHLNNYNYFYDYDYVNDSAANDLAKDVVASGDTIYLVSNGIASTEGYNVIADHIRGGYDEGYETDDCEKLTDGCMKLWMAHIASDSLSEYYYAEVHLYLTMAALATYVLAHAFLGYCQTIEMNDTMKRKISRLEQRLRVLEGTYLLKPEDAEGYFDDINAVAFDESRVD